MSINATLDPNQLQTIQNATQNSNDIATLNANNGTSASTPQIDQSQFLTLLTAQLKNQDPLQPMDNGAFLGELAQFSSAAGMQQLQQSFADLSSSITSNQTLQASALLGRQVLVDGNSGYLSAGGSINGAIDLTDSAADVQVQVKNSAGAVVDSFDLGQQAAGRVPMMWNGIQSDGSQAPAGMYTFTVSAINGTTSTAPQTLIQGTVESVTVGGASSGSTGSSTSGSSGSSGLMLSVSGIGNVALSDVKVIG